MRTNEAAWHAERRQRIRENHPEVKTLYGRDAITVVWILGLSALQFGIGFAIAEQPWWIITLVALTIGALISHALGVIIHEASHNLIVRSTFWNQFWGIMANLAIGAPASVEFRAQHLLHHRRLGDVSKDDDGGEDTQCPLPTEDAWVGTSTWRKILSFTVGRFYWGGRAAGKVPWSGWMAFNWAAIIVMATVVIYFGGLAAYLYLPLASLFAFGPSVCGARRISEHIPIRPGQPTNSYYGMLNWVSLNVGYHNEHHDFPMVPWTRLKALKRLAPEEYEPLFHYTSWGALMLQYFFDPRYRVNGYVGFGPYLGEDPRPLGSRPGQVEQMRRGIPNSAA